MFQLRTPAKGLPYLLSRLQAGSPCSSFSNDSAFLSLESLVTQSVRTLSNNATSSSSGFMSWLPHDKGGQRPRIATPLTNPLPNLVNVPAFKPTAQPPPTEITTLPNGVRIVSEASPGPTASLGIYVNSGSIYEDESTSGCSALLECLAFKSSTHRDSMRIMKEVEKIGSSIMANASREQMSYTIDTLKSSTPAALEILCDGVLNPAFAPGEVEDQKGRLVALLSGKDVAMTLLNELLVQKAYKGALGSPLIPTLENLPRLSPEVLRGFVARNYVGPRLVLAAAGVAHDELVKLAEPMLAQVPAATPQPEPSSSYEGGFVHLPGSFPQANLVLAFEYQGGWRDVKGAVIMTVLTYLMGGGNSFSSGGPGKGMHSRLYTRVLNQYHWVHSCSAFNSTFNGSGLVGIQAGAEPANALDMLSVMCHELDAVSRSVNVVELERAKRAATSIIYNALESKATSAEDIGRQFLTYGHRISGAQYVDMIQSVTPADVTGFVTKLLGSRPSLAAYGDGTDAVQYEAVLSRFGGSSKAAAAGQQQQQQSAGSRFRSAFNWRP